MTKYRIKRENKFVEVSPHEMTFEELKRVIKRMKISYYDSFVGITVHTAKLWTKNGKVRIYIPYYASRNGVQSGYFELKDGVWKDHIICPEINLTYEKAHWEKIKDLFIRKYKPIMDEIATRIISEKKINRGENHEL